MACDVVFEAECNGGRVLDHEKVSGGGDFEALGVGKPGLHECGAFDEP